MSAHDYSFTEYYERLLLEPYVLIKVIPFVNSLPESHAAADMS